MLLCNVGVLKTVQCTAVWEQWPVAGWLGPSVAVRVKVRVHTLWHAGLNDAAH